VKLASLQDYKKKFSFCLKITFNKNGKTIKNLPFVTKSYFNIRF